MADWRGWREQVAAAAALLRSFTALTALVCVAHCAAHLLIPLLFA